MYKIEKLDHKGRGITFKDNKITFIENALPNEIVEIKVLKEKKKFNEGIVDRIITKNYDRVEPVCPCYELCGGCNIMHLTYEKQLQYKKEKVMEILKRYGDIEFNIKEIISSDNFYYRNKVTFQVREKIGFYKDNTYDLICIDKCYIADDKINKILDTLKKIDLKGIYQIVIRTSKFLNQTMVVFKTNSDLKFDVNILDANSVIMYNGEYKTLKGNDYILEKLGNLNFIISPDSFFQVNSSNALKLYNKVLEFSDLKGKEKVLDLFCGTGTIGLFLANYCRNVVGIEINKYAVEDAKKNAKLNNINNIEFICDDAKNVKIKELDVVVVDPPRSGLDIKTINYLKELECKKIVYVSCDPMTLARDLKLLNDEYEVKDICLVDMFPNTYHVETVVKLEKR